MSFGGGAWSAIQLGAREHYAIPRALLAHGVPTTLVTDLWFAGPGSRLLPRDLRDRSHPGIPSERVRSFNTAMLAFEASARLRGVNGWPRIEERNRRFGRLASSIDHGDVIFSYSYAALDVFERARAGATKILGQIDPGPFEQDLVEEVHQRHGLPRPPRPSADYWDRWTSEHQLADVIVVNSTWSRDALVERGVDAEKIQVIPLAYEAESAAIRRTVPKKFTPERPLEILFLGQVIVRKGILELLEAARKLKGAPVRWTIIGGGDPALLAELGAEPNIEVTGPVPRSAAREHYSRADVFCLPTHSDGFALTQLEAAASGLPLIVSRHCGDVVQNGRNGIVLREVSAEALVEAVETVLRRPDLLEAMSEQASQLEDFSLTRIGERLIEAATRRELQDRNVNARPV